MGSGQLRNVRGMKSVGRVGAIATVIAVLGTLLAGAWLQGASAASLTNPPTRLYVAPPGSSLSASFAGVPVGNLAFTGTDPISNQARELTVNAEDGPLGCDPKAANDWFIDDCTRVQMDVSHGTISVGPLTTQMTAMNQPVYLASGGAVVDQSANPPNGPTTLLHINGTQAQLQDALDNLVYTPDAGYWYTGSNPETLNIDVVSGDPMVAATQADVEIRVLDENAYPNLTGPAGPIDAKPSEEKVITGYDVDDQDNDEDVDGLQANPPQPAPDPVDGAGTDLLLIAKLTCGKTIDPMTEGFNLQGGTFVSGFPTVVDLLENKYDVTNHPENQVIVDAVMAKVDLADPTVGTMTLPTSSPTQYTHVFAGVGSMKETLYALGKITFLQNDENDSCVLETIVSDLGNNGLPTKYEGMPPTGVETPDVGVDVHNVTIDVGPKQQVTATFNGPITADEGTSADITINISPATHPAFDILVSTVDGTANAGSDFLGRTDATVNVPQDATTVVFGTNVYSDQQPEGQQDFQYAMKPGQNEPAGWKVNATSVATVTIIDKDDAARQIMTVSDPAVTEGDLGTKNLTFTLTLDGPADGNESVLVSTLDGSATVADLDYAPVVAQTVSFAANSTTATVDVAIKGDTTVEPDESFQLVLSGAQNTSVVDPFGVGTITNDDMPADPPPGVTIDQAGAQADPTSASPIQFSVLFTEPVTGFDGSDVSFSGSTVGGSLMASVSGSGASYTVSVTGMSGNGDVVASIPAASALDSANQSNLASTSVDNTVTYQQPADPAPTVTINQAGGQADPTSSSPILFSVVFSEAVTGFGNADISFAGSTVGGSLAAAVSGSGPAYTVSVTGMTGNGDVIASIPAGAAMDSANQPSSASTSNDNNVTFTTPADPAPTVTIDQAAGQTDPASSGPITFTVVFSEPVTGFTGGDVSLAGSTATGALVAGVSGSGANYTVSVSGLVGGGAVVASIPAGAALDSANQMSLASTSVDNTVQFAPPATHFAVVAPPAANVGSSFSVSVTALDAGDVTATGYTGTVHLTSSDGAAVLPADATLTNGTGSFSVTLNTTGNQTVTATDTASASVTGTSGMIAVSALPPGPATHLMVTAPPTSTAGAAFNVTVTALDAANATATGYSGTVHLTSTDGTAVLPADATLTNGTGSFSVTLKQAGAQGVTATDTVTASITGTTSVTVAAAAPKQFKVSPPPPGSKAGVPLSLTVTVEDQYGNTVTSYAGTIHFTSTDPNAVLPADALLTNGTGTFLVTFKTAGMQSVGVVDVNDAALAGASIATTIEQADPGPTTTTTTSTTSTTTPTSTTTQPTDGSTTTSSIPGDVNGDGVVDALDAVSAPVSNGISGVSSGNATTVYTTTGALPITGTDVGVLLAIGLVLVSGGLVLALRYGRKQA